MKLPDFITNNFTAETRRRRVFSFVFFVLFCGYFFPVSAQKIAVITPEKNPNSEKMASQFTERLKGMDADLVEMAVKRKKKKQLITRFMFILV